MGADPAGKLTRVSALLELVLAVANLALAAWSVWATVNSRRFSEVPPATPSAATITDGYLLEVLVLSFLAIFIVLVSIREGARPLRWLWACLGALTGLAVLGAWSIGPLLAPGVVLVLVAALLAAMRTRAPIGALLVWGLAGLACQVALMLLVIAVVLGGQPSR